MTMKSFVATAACLLPLVIAAPTERNLVPTVKLDYAKVVGLSLLGVDSFKGIPYAQPPVGQLRLKPPQPITTNLGTLAAVGVPRACPQFYTGFNSSSLPSYLITTLLNSPLLQIVTNSGEDCLTLNVQRPATATASSKLPVVFWMFGGGFQFGSTQMYDGSELILTSMAKKQDIIYVSVNYRTGGFGFLAGDEILKDGSANIGLLDQRAGLKWVADNIAKFGGDPTKVTIWGESAGSISVLDQMVAYNGDNTYKGKPLFRAGIMDSGSIIPADPVNGVKGNDIYNDVVRVAGCEGSADTLNCLRGVDYQTFLRAATSVPSITDYSSVALSYVPRPDGVFLTESPEVLVQKGLIAKVPYIVGDQEDEGTLFALSQTNVTTTAKLVTYLKDVFFYDATVAQIEQLVSLYPDDASAGSPFRTGSYNQIYPQFKRLAAILGDLTFTLTRRVFLATSAAVNPSVPSWSYLASYGYGTPILGTFHASDLLPTYGIVPSFSSTTIQSYYISFINYMDPNQGASGQINWPRWNNSQQLINFNALKNSLVADNFRNEVSEFLIIAQKSFHI